MVLLIVCLYSPIKWRLYRLLCYILCIIINYSITLHCQPSQHKTICLDQNANYGLQDVHLSTILCFHSWRGRGRLCISALTLVRQSGISAPDSESGPAPARALAQLYPVIISISCADQTDRDVSPAVITDRVQNNANFLIPFATLKIHSTFAKTIQVLSAYCISIPKASLFEKYFHFCL